MTRSDTEVVIIGGGAAGVAAGRRLHDAGIACLIVEARARLGGRAWSVVDSSGNALDLGCGWLHSADRNPWSAIAEAQGGHIDKTPPPWKRLSSPIGFPIAEQHEFRAALTAFHEWLEAGAEQVPDIASAELLDHGGRWNSLINAVTTYISGTELDRLSRHDFARYEDTGVNWRVVEGYGTTVVRHARGVPVVFDCPVTRIDHSGKRLRIETTRGTLTADRAIVTLPSAMIAEQPDLFLPALPHKVDAAAGLPLGLADKLFLSLDHAEEFETDIRLAGHTDRTETALFHVRPFGRPQIEAYFGGRLAGMLEAAGEAAFFDFARSELTGLLGSDFARRIAPLHLHRWGQDRFARGSYSYALPGKADCRAVLAEPAAERLLFAGEACSPHDFSTAHGAFATGIAAAEEIIAARQRKSAR